MTPTPPKPTAILAHIAKYMDDVIGITPQQGADLLKLFAVNLENLLESQSAPTNPEYSIKLQAKAREEEIQAALDLITLKSMRLSSDNFARVSVQLYELQLEKQDLQARINAAISILESIDPNVLIYAHLERTFANLLSTLQGETSNKTGKDNQ